jgi:hypothetical protein
MIVIIFMITRVILVSDKFYLKFRDLPTKLYYSPNDCVYPELIS